MDDGSLGTLVDESLADITTIMRGVRDKDGKIGALIVRMTLLSKIDATPQLFWQYSSDWTGRQIEGAGRRRAAP